jgi:hypothetical protein
MMSEQGTRAVAAVTRLRAALEQTAAAMARPHLETLLAGESEIEGALADLTVMDSLSTEEQHAVRVEVDKTRGALVRCQRLGHALDHFVRISLEAQGRGEYGPRRTASSYAGQALDARV